MKINLTKLNEDNEPKGFTTQHRTLKRDNLLKYGRFTDVKLKHDRAAQKAIRDEENGIVQFTESGKPKHVVRLCENAKAAKLNRLKEIEKDEFIADRIYSVVVARKLGCRKYIDNSVNTHEITNQYAQELGIEL